MGTTTTSSAVEQSFPLFNHSKDSRGFQGRTLFISALCGVQLASCWPNPVHAASYINAIDPANACIALRHADVSGHNVTILDTIYYNNATEIETLGTCASTAQISNSLCRVQFVVNTSDVSALTAEAWLPTAWSGRLLALGNGGLNGCLDYENLEYGTSLGFASIASNNGHNGDSGAAFANNSEVLADYTSRSIHIESVVGKALISSYYERSPHHSYYMGCSTGGRQGIYAALYHPSDFDGVLAGAPAINFNYLLGWTAMISKYIGAPYGEKSPSFIPSQLWDVVAKEVLRQCDSLDGVIDGVITEPDACEFRPEELLCGHRDAVRCLSEPQVKALRRIYSPLHGQNGEILFPRFDPGAEASPGAEAFMFSGRPHPYPDDWMKYVIYDDPLFNYSHIDLAAIAHSQALDPGNISTFSGDFSAFYARGGKLITYHGRADPLIPSGNSKSLYDLASRTLAERSETLDEFYRLFLVPGMGHCLGGRGGVRFGQDARSAIPEATGNDAQGPGDVSQRVLKYHNQSETEQPTNIILALVDWVEHGNAPESIVGISDDEKITRRHCRYPQKSHWTGNRWKCLKD